MKDWRTVDLDKTGRDTRFPPPCVSVSQDTHPQCQYPAKSQLGPQQWKIGEPSTWTRQGGTPGSPPYVSVSQDTHPQCQYPAKSQLGPQQWKIGEPLTWTRQGGTPGSPPPCVSVSKDTHPQCQYPAKSQLGPQQWKIGEPSTWTRQGGTPGSPPPACRCHRTPTLNANTQLKANKNHNSERLENRRLGQDREGHQVPPPLRVGVTGHPPSMPIPS